MQIRRATAADRLAWDAYVLGHPAGLPYQLFAWQEAVAAAYGFSGAYLVAATDSRLCGVLPLILFQVPLMGRSLFSLPYCDAGGVLADNEAVAAQLLAQAGTLARDLGARCTIRAAAPLDGAGANLTGKVRMVLSLPASSEQLLAGLKSKLRSQVKKPLRDGLTARLGLAELLDDFYRIYAENMRELGSPAHSRQWLAAVLQAYGPRARITVVSTADGVPVAAGLVLLHDATVVIPWASSLRRYNSLNPNMLLYWTFLAFAADNGFREFDFGRSTPGEGTWRFKAQWGAVPRQLYWYELTGDGAPQPDGLSVGRRVLSAVWSRLPLAVANRLGPALRKYVSL